MGRKRVGSDGKPLRRNTDFRREREGRKWSREDLADWATELAGHRGFDGAISADLIYRIEEEGVVPREAWRRELFCDLFELPPQYLGFPTRPAVLSPRTPVAPRIDDPTIGPDSDPVDSDDMRRRELAKALALLAGGAALGGVDIERVAAILTGLRPDAKALDGLETLTNDLIRRESNLAPQVLLPEVEGHLRGLQEVLSWTPSSLASRAYSLTGSTALLAGYLMFKQQRLSEADTYWSLGEHLGDAAGDVRLRAMILQLQSWRWGDENPSLSLTLLNRAESLLERHSEPDIAALIYARRAVRYAETGHIDRGRVSLALHDIAAVHEQLGAVGPAERVYIIENVADEAVTMQALAFLALDRPLDAVADLQRILDSIPASSLSWRAYAAADLAAARAKMGDAEEAAELLTSSLQLAAAADALRCMVWVRTCREQWLTDLRLPAVRRLDEQIRALPLAQVTQ